MKQIFFIIAIIGGILVVLFVKNPIKIISPLGSNGPKPTPKPLLKYSFSNLKQRKFEGSEIQIGKVLKDTETITSRMFYFTSDGKKVSGLINIPNKNGFHPVIIMIRGYVDQKIYAPGVGTQHAGEVFAQNGFITLAPDFLGYGESDKPSSSSIEERFETYTTMLNLLASIPKLNDALKKAEYKDVSVNSLNIGVWAHSNGGQIALSILEITGRAYPTVLWTPVSKPFPYSILYYTDEFDDRGKALRKVVSEFEKDYNADNYSLTSYLDWINAPIQLYQGGQDEAVPQKWSDQLYNTLQDFKKDIEYYPYPTEDHNFAQGNWSNIVLKNIAFYKTHFEASRQ